MGCSFSEGGSKPGSVVVKWSSSQVMGDGCCGIWTVFEPGGSTSRVFNA